MKYFTVVVYKFLGIGSEATFENVLASSQDEAIACVIGSKPWYRLNPMYAYEQDGRK